MGGGLRDWVKKAKALRSRNWQLKNSHGDVKHDTGNTVNDILIAVVSGGSWTHQGDRCVSYIDV